MLLPELDFFPPSTSLCGDCSESIDLMGKYQLECHQQKPFILKDLAVKDVIVFEKAIRGDVLPKRKDLDRAVRAI